MLNKDDMTIHRNKRTMRLRLTQALRGLAVAQRRERIAQVFFDLACRVDGPIDKSRLPANPDGFVVKQPTILKSGKIAFDILCLYQVVSMATLYYWLYAEMRDAQDARSFERYIGWIEEYLKAPETYSVVGSVRDGYWLYPLKGTSKDKPNLPEWLQANEGETV